ncbi:MAG: OmpA family protein [Myxococcales bacterium]|nr:OmpA family protein [Myxococcales bacterium]
MASGGVATKRQVRRVRRVADPRATFMPWGLLPLLALILLVFFAMVPFARGCVQQTTLRSAQQALADAGQGWAVPEVNGQWVVVTGRPPSQEAATLALDAVRNATANTVFFGRDAVPATSVTGQFQWDAPAAVVDNPSPEWTFRLSNGVLQLVGEVPDEITRTALVDAAQLALDPPRVVAIEDALVVTDVDAPDGFADVALRGVRTVGQCDRGYAEFACERFSLRCELPQAAANKVQTEASAPLPTGRLGTIEVLSHEAVASCEGSLSEILGKATIEFATSSATIGASSNPLLDSVAEAADACPGTLRIEGHTDNTGEASFNEELSRKRAESVRAALVQRGLSGSRLVAQGYGSRKPIADNRTAAGRAHNRRIEIRVVRASD